MLVAVVALVGAYILGTFPTAHLVGRRIGVDPTTQGSGNPGASNMLRVGGKWSGALVFAGDVLKGAAAAAVGLALDGRPLGVACWVAATIGHIFPVQRRFRGGKGVATGGGGALVLFILPALVCLGAFVVAISTTKKASVASLAMAVLLAPLVAVFGGTWWEILVSAGVSALVIARHRSNIQRLLAGREATV